MTEIGTTEQRQARRDSIFRAQIDLALAHSMTLERSLKCGGARWGYSEPLHADQEGGCANDGSGCLCECHDPAVHPASEQDRRAE